MNRPSFIYRRMHFRPDVIENVLCLSPNRHVLLDTGSIFISDDFDVIETEAGKRVATLRSSPTHQLSVTALVFKEQIPRIEEG